MDARDFLPYLGKADGSPEITELLGVLGVKKRPKLKRGDCDVYVDLPKKGLVLVFELPETDDSKLLSLNDVQFYAGLPMQDSDRFGGRLPDGLVFEDSRTDARTKLGPPTESVETSHLDVWERQGYSIVVEYRRDLSSVALLHLSLPDAT